MGDMIDMGRYVRTKHPRHLPISLVIICLCLSFFFQRPVDACLGLSHQFLLHLEDPLGRRPDPGRPTVVWLAYRKGSAFVVSWGLISTYFRGLYIRNILRALPSVFINTLCL